MDSKKSNKIRDIVRLQQMLKKWKKLANSAKNITTSSNQNSNSRSAVCVGEELKRFIIPTEYLGHPAFRILLRKAEEEFGFQQTGVLRIPYQVSVFESILKIVKKKKDMLFLQDLGNPAQLIITFHHPQTIKA
ncbi:hypothetical protein HS088_TW04G00013 [Tripterygium wilfordii]|uniref:SAUR-like auxin-responsive protein family n=1 Tax=Tripterygium wilfordii TaxID=458696 RepID=A0A7J7DNZ2_TRIWF|nr:hypothetical protein HS088_TW04G00013 [Tripterygium wilfordii]